MDCVWQAHHVFQQVRHWQPDPGDYSGNGCATSPQDSDRSAKNEEHSDNDDWADLSAEREVIYRSDSGARDQPDSDTYRYTGWHSHANYFTV